MGRVAHSGDRASVQARRTTTFTLPTVFGDITLDATDIENDVATIDHAVATDNLTLVRDGLVWIYYAMNFGPIGVTNSTAYIEARVRVNDTTVLDGSLRAITDFDDNSLEGNDLQNGLSNGFQYQGVAGDFITLQAQYTQVSGNDPVPIILAGLTFGAVAQFN